METFVTKIKNLADSDPYGQAVGADCTKLSNNLAKSLSVLKKFATTVTDTDINREIAKTVKKKLLTLDAWFKKLEAWGVNQGHVEPFAKKRKRDQR